MGDDFKSRLDAVRARIERAARRAGRDPGGVTLVAVSKSVPVERLREAAACGCRLFGENRVQEALAKMEAWGDCSWETGKSEAPAAPGRAGGVAEDGASWRTGGGRVQTGASEPIPMGARAPDKIDWHLIGPLQTNKVKAAVGRFALLH